MLIDDRVEMNKEIICVIFIVYILLKMINFLLKLKNEMHYIGIYIREVLHL